MSTLFYVPVGLIGGFSLEFSEGLIFDSTLYINCPTLLASERDPPLAVRLWGTGLRFGLVFR